jgi:multiple sugar transport system ATP-binding protein
MNLLEGRLTFAGDAAHVQLGEDAVPLPAALLAERTALRSYDGRPVVVGIRPESFRDAALERGSDRPRIRAEVELREALGAEILVHLCVEARNAVTDDERSLLAAGDDAAVEQLERKAQEDRGAVIARFEPSSRARIGDAIEIAIDVDRIHLFDPETGLAIRT